ncbi:C-C motif chemokine 3-like [Hippoglossus stenolepis]|uniref:C-C motif chemokine 3-like n=1 Tax=Hippoglossus stenolepis TaxID=195615 RepID=UPI00159C5068|nr:C-C motif chemokine 3-like [Hippoglossus stenolepis]
MKTLCFTLGLLLLTVCCCNAIPRGVSFTAPRTCCQNFSTQELPSERVTSITETDRSCSKKAFIVQTVKGRQICYSRTFKWAQDVYNLLHNTEY